jgi:hypothetical protein
MAAAEVLKVKLRTIDYLTPEQLKRKREVDRKSQRQARERTRSYISELECKIRESDARIQLLEQELAEQHPRLKQQQQEEAGKAKSTTTDVETQPGGWSALPQNDDFADRIPIQTQSTNDDVWNGQTCGLEIDQLMTDSSDQGTCQLSYLVRGIAKMAR